MNAILKDVEDDNHYAVFGDEVVCMSKAAPSTRHIEAELLIRSKVNSGYIVAPRNQVFLVSSLRVNSTRVGGSAAVAILQRVKGRLRAQGATGLTPVTTFATTVVNLTSQEFYVPLTVDYVCKWARRNGLAITPIRAEQALILLRRRFELGHDFGYDALARCIKDAALTKRAVLVG